MKNLRKKRIDEAKNLPYISLEEFEKKVEEKAEELPLLKQLLETSTWDNLPIHLLNELFARIGAKPEINKY